MYSATFLAVAGLLAVPVSAFWRLPCVSPLVQERADPIINPGAVSGHLHTIMGGNGFDFTMDYSSTQSSSCTSCTVKGDFSNYWTPVLFYQHQNGSVEKVNQIGGATVYYLQRNATGETLTAFPKGFRMVAGDPFKRSSGTDAASQAISYNCLNYNGPAQPETPGFPTNNCPSGLRSQVFFPSCWDGKNLDSLDHKSHVSYPDGAYNAGKCPSSHPVRLVSIFYEIIWDTNKFADAWHGGSQPFMWSMGDPTGFGFHGDFLNGWDVDLLQRAVNTCTNLSGRVEDCPVFTLYPDSQSQGCRIPSKVDEPITGILDALPGCNLIQQGPSAAKPASNTCPSTISNKISTVSNSVFFTDLTREGWAYQGCATDNYYTRSMSAATTSSDTMTNEACATFCTSKGFTLAATEYGRECYCGNSFPTDRLPVSGVVGNCNMPCAGNKTEWCGSSGLMSLYKECEGSECVNVQVGAGGSSSSSSSSSPSSSSTASGAVVKVVITSTATQAVSSVALVVSSSVVTTNTTTSIATSESKSTSTTTTAVAASTATEWVVNRRAAVQIDSDESSRHLYRHRHVRGHVAGHSFEKRRIQLQ